LTGQPCWIDVEESGKPKIFKYSSVKLRRIRAAVLAKTYGESRGDSGFAHWAEASVHSPITPRGVSNIVLKTMALLERFNNVTLKFNYDRVKVRAIERVVKRATNGNIGVDDSLPKSVDEIDITSEL
jgi:hypothetical protein